MKYKAVLIGLLLSMFPATTLARPDGHGYKGGSQKVERTMAVDSAATVSLCITSGNITVRGWDKNEVLAQSRDAVQIELISAEPSPTSDQIKKLEIVVLNKAETRKPQGKCQAYSDIELYIPRGATVLVQTRDGNIDIAEIASAYARTQNGDITVQRVSHSIELGGIGGSISIKDSSGRVSVTSAGGGVEAANIRPWESGDDFEVMTIGGDIVLNQITHKQLNVRTVSGNVSVTGSLAAGGRYGFKSFSGDVTLALPANSSFRLSAKVSHGGDIVTDFPLTPATEMTMSGLPKSAFPVAPAPASPPLPPKAAPKTGALPAGATPQFSPAAKGATDVDPAATDVLVRRPSYTLHRINAVYGTGDATISVASFSGTLHLKQN